MFSNPDGLHPDILAQAQSDLSVWLLTPTLFDSELVLFCYGLSPNQCVEINSLIATDHTLLQNHLIGTHYVL